MSKLRKSGGEIWYVVYYSSIVGHLLVKPQSKFFFFPVMIFTWYLFLYPCFFSNQTLRARVAAKTEEKKLELLFIQWSEHHKKLCNFIRCIFLRMI